VVINPMVVDPSPFTDERKNEQYTYYTDEIMAKNTLSKLKLSPMRETGFGLRTDQTPISLPICKLKPYVYLDARDIVQDAHKTEK